MGHGQIPKGMCVCHTCDNRKCVRPSHLFLDTQQGNILDAYRKGRIPGNGGLKGTDNPKAKLTEKEVKQIRKDTRPHRTIAKEYGVGAPTVSAIKTRKTWKHVK
jgi:DNA invertase Pin-like site-specific DNA recombinase